MDESQFECQYNVVERLSEGDREVAAGLSTGESLYVALAANDLKLLSTMNYIMAEALARSGAEWTAMLIARWEHRSNPLAGAKTP